MRARAVDAAKLDAGLFRQPARQRRRENAGVAVGLRLTGAFVLRFFAGFCLIANGAYISLGSFDRIGDCGEMLRLDTPIWLLWLFGAATMPAGLWLWHRQGPHFGLGPAAGRVNRGVAYATLAGCVVLVVLGFAVGDQF